MIDLIVLLIIAFAFGISSKIADLFNEHGLKQPFVGATTLFGILWGLFGSLMIIMNPQVGLYYFGLILYWILRVKLDYRNHAIGGLLILLSGFYLLPIKSHLLNIICIVIFYDATKFLEDFFKKNNRWKICYPIIKTRIYFIPLAYAFFFHEPISFIVSSISILGVKLTHRYFKSYQQKEVYEPSKINKQ